MSPAIDLSFGDAELAVHGFARQGAGASVWIEGTLHTFANATFDGSALRDSGGLNLVLEPTGPAATFADGATQQLCHVRGDAPVVGSIDCLGTRADAAPPARAVLSRDVTARFDAETAFALRAHRTRAKDSHEDEAVQAFALRPQSPVWLPIADPRLSTTYRDSGDLLRVGIELWESDESTFADRLAAEVLAVLPLGTSQVALCLWRYRGSTGTGHYALDAT